MVEVTISFLLLIPGMVPEIQRVISKMACIVIKTTNITAKSISRNHQEMDEVRSTLLQNRTTMFYLLLKHNLGCQHFLDMCLFNVSCFSHTIDGQIDNLQAEVDKISQMTTVWPSWFGWLSPSSCPLLAILVILLCLPILVRLAIKSMHSTLSYITATIFSLKTSKWEM